MSNEKYETRIAVNERRKPRWILKFHSPLMFTGLS